MLTKQQADDLLEKFRLFVWNQEKREFDDADLKHIESIIRESTMPPEDELGCPDIETHYYLQGVKDATVTAQCTISDEINDMFDLIKNGGITREQTIIDLEDSIDVNIDYMLSGD